MSMFDPYIKFNHETVVDSMGKVYKIHDQYEINGITVATVSREVHVDIGEPWTMRCVTTLKAGRFSYEAGAFVHRVGNDVDDWAGCNKYIDETHGAPAARGPFGVISWFRPVTLTGTRCERGLRASFSFWEHPLACLMRSTSPPRTSC